ncbi:MAG: hypothetical protein LRZ88_09505 [Candidatus Cloacimonetes bacterium]|nr:hypothetical protein [Candidatus Cloacimonadota bacterium]
MKQTMLFIALLIMVLGAFSSLNAQVLITVGDGTATNTTTGNPTPYGTYYKNFRQQYLIMASELEDLGGGGGPINSLAFNVDNVNNCSPMPNFTIRMKHTSQAVLSTTLKLGDYTPVFVQNDFLPVTGWNTHTFTTPWVWDGSSNIFGRYHYHSHPRSIHPKRISVLYADYRKHLSALSKRQRGVPQLLRPVP